MLPVSDLDVLVATLLGYYVDKVGHSCVVRSPDNARYTDWVTSEEMAWAVFFARCASARWTKDLGKALALFGDQRLALLHDPAKGWSVYLGDFSDDIEAAMSVPDTRWSKTPAESVVLAWLDWKGE